MILSPLKHPRIWVLAGFAGLSPLASHSLSGRPLAPLVQTAQADDELGQDVGKNLQQAQTALAARNTAKAMSFVNAADAVKSKSEYETYVIAQMRAAVASQSGDVPAAIKAYDVLISSHRTPATARKQMLMAEASLAYGARDYAAAAQAATRYLHEAGPSAQMQTLLLQCHYLQQDWKGVVTAGRAILTTDQKTHQVPPENQLQMLATAYDKLHDIPGKTTIYVQLVKHYARPQYWQMLLHDLTADSTMTPRLVFNLQRFRLITGLLTAPSDFQDMGERAVQMGLPQLALNLLDDGYNRHLLGTGAGAASQAHFRAFVAQQAAQVRNGLPAAVAAAKADANAGPSLTAGYNLILNGQVDAGIALMQEGLHKNPRFPEVAQLTFGMALLDGGRRADAIKLFDSMEGDSTADNLAQLWAVRLSSKAAQ